MRKRVLVLTGALLLGACDDDDLIFDPSGGPAPPIGVEATYYNRAVTVYWELASGWNGEAFRVFSKRVGDESFFFIAEVTSCSSGLCEYTDTNISSNVSYDYFVSAVDPDTGVETDSERTVRVSVPSFTPPPVPKRRERQYGCRESKCCCDGRELRRSGSVASATEDRETHQKRDSDHSPAVHALGESICHPVITSATSSGGTLTSHI